ncbi:MAG TPA: hypothetical protein DIW45_09885, partial [Erythrobacter sp.]|nr:hypothetical protein [Erythrobacter sp.]
DNLGEAISVFEQSELANSLLGEDFVRLYAHTRKMELEGYQQAVGDSPSVDISDWELMRYADTV